MPDRPRFLVPLFFAVIFLGAIVLGPLIYFGVGVAWPIPFHRAMDRALLVSALAALVFFGPRVEWRRLWPAQVGAWKQVLLGLGLAFVATQLLLGLDLAVAGFHGAALDGSRALERVLMAVIAAVLAAPLEETIFRGFLQTELGRGFGWRAGWMGAAAIYTLAHFVKIPVELDSQPVHLWSGASALGSAFTEAVRSLAKPENALKAVNLFVLGLLLGGLFLRAGQLWINAGLHGGLILTLLLFTGFARVDEPPRTAHFGGDLLSSPLTLVVFLALGLWIWRYYRNPSNVPEIGESAR